MRLFLIVLLAICATSAHAEIRILAEVGEPAIGLPGLVYFDVGEPAMGRAGHVAFNGTGDTSIISSGNQTDGVWTGQPDAISLILQGNDPISGLPGNVLFKAPKASSIVTRSGYVGLLANLTGAVVVNQTDDAVVAHVDGVTELVLREGVQAPGFPAGVIVSGNMPFSFSDGGMLVVSTVSTGPSGLWFWDFESTELIAATGGSAEPDLPGCALDIIFQFAINDAGQIFFRASLSGIGCPGNAIFKFVGGELRNVVADDDPVPGMANTGFENPGNVSFKVNDAGDVTFRSFLRRGDGAGAHSLWVVRASGAIELLALEDESLKGDSNELLLNQFFVRAHSVDQAVTALKVFSTTKQSILAGPPRANQPYPVFEAAGESQLDVLAQEGAQPPGFPATWFYEAFDLGPPMIGGAGFVAWTATVADALAPNSTQTVGVWGDNSQDGPELLVAEDMPFQSGGVERTLSRIFYTPEVSSQSGLASQISESGQVLLFVDTLPSRRAIVLVPESAGLGTLAALVALAAIGVRRSKA